MSGTDPRHCGALDELHREEEWQLGGFHGVMDQAVERLRVLVE
jgi:hypothetical protein